MTTFRSPTALANHQRQTAQKKRKAFTLHSAVQVHKVTARLNIYAQNLLSGTISTATLRRLGHPFATNRIATGYVRRRRNRPERARRKAFGTVPLLPINEQTGVLKARTNVYSRKIGESTWQIRLRSNAPYSSFILSERGTQRMKARGYIKELRKYATKLDRQITKFGFHL